MTDIILIFIWGRQSMDSNWGCLATGVL